MMDHRHEFIARSMAASEGFDPDTLIALGEPQRVRNGYCAGIGPIVPLWSQYLRLAVASTEAIDAMLEQAK